MYVSASLKRTHSDLLFTNPQPLFRSEIMSRKLWSYDIQFLPRTTIVLSPHGSHVDESSVVRVQDQKVQVKVVVCLISSSRKSTFVARKDMDMTRYLPIRPLMIPYREGT